MILCESCSVFFLAMMGASGVLGTEGSPVIVSPVPNEEKKFVEAQTEEAVSVHQVGGPKVLLAPLSTFENNYEGVVKVDSASLFYDYSMPWMPGDYRQGTGTAFLIGKGLFLTNAHVVSNAERIYISQYGDSRQTKATVLHIAHDCDLALIQVEQGTEFDAMKPFKIGRLPRLEDEVRAIGFPVGGERLSVTRGVVSRIDTNSYAHSKSDSHLTVQIDAAINPGNSGGPVLIGNEVVGVAFQGMNGADNTGYIIPTPVIRRFLKDVEDGTYDSYVNLGVITFPILNPAMRKKLDLPDDEVGVLVGDIYQSGSATGVLEVGDVILAIDGSAVDSSGMVLLEGERLSMNELSERKFAGDKLGIKFKRKGEVFTKEVVLKPLESRRILAAQYDDPPRYVVFAGFVFQPATRNSIVENNINNPVMGKAVEEFVLRTTSTKDQDIVLLTRVLPDEINERVNAGNNGIVDSINGVKVENLSHLYALLTPKELPEFFVIQLKNSNVPIVISGQEVSAANARISERYSISQEARLGK